MTAPAAPVSPDSIAVPPWRALGFASADDAAAAATLLARSRAVSRPTINIDALTDDDRRALVMRICERVAEGGVGNTFKAAAVEEGITRALLFRWVNQDRELKRVYDEARIGQAHGTLEDALDIADNATPDTVHVARLQVDTRKFFAAKIAPKIYGDKLELSTPAGIPLAAPTPTRFDPSKLSVSELEQLETLYAKGVVVNALPDGEQIAEVMVPAPPAGLALPAITGDQHGRP